MTNRNLKIEYFSFLEENNIVWPETGLPLTLNDENFISRAISLISIPIILILDGLDKVNES